MDWTHNGAAITPDSQQFSVLDTIDGRTIRSVVLIRQIKSEHLGQFRCQMKNRYGSDTATIELREKGEN